MPRFRKKPVEIEAHRMPEAFTWPMTKKYVDALAEWCGGEIQQDGSVLIVTLEGDMRADLGDWVIRGVKGEFYPCKPDIFEATYDEVAP